MKQEKQNNNNSIIINNNEIEYKCDDNVNDTSEETRTTMVAITPSSLSSSPSTSFSSNHLRHRIGNTTTRTATTATTSHDKYTTANANNENDNNTGGGSAAASKHQQQQHIPQEQHPRYYDDNIQSHQHTLPQSDCSMMAHNSSVDVTRNDAADASQQYHSNDLLEGEEEKEVDWKLKKDRFNNNNNNNYHEIIGTLRIRMELRQLGGLMFVLGIGSAFSTMALISHLIVGESGSMQVEGFLLPILVGNILQLCCGLTAMGCGFIALLLGPYPSRSFHKACKFTTLIINLGPIAFVITVMRIIQGAKDPPEVNNFIPMELNPNQTDIKFCSAMGVLVLVSVCCSLIGGLTVLGLHMCAILGQQPHSRHRSYHYIRLVYYNLLVMIGGLSQLLLGAYLWVRFGSGPYEQPVHVAAYTIHFPIVSVVVGIVQTMMGLLGIYWHKPRYSKDDHSFIYIVGLTWLITTALQFILQPAYSNDDMYNAEGATVASVYLGFFVMPIFLDYSVRNTPIQPRPEYYGLPSDSYYNEDLLSKLLKMEPKNHNCKTTTLVEEINTTLNTTR